MDYIIVIALLLLGVIFFIIELFLLPGITIAGVVGFLFTGGSVFYAYSYLGNGIGTLTLLASILLFILAVWLFMRSKTLDKLSLKTDIDSKVAPLKGIKIHEGDIGVTMSRLAPMGKIRINGSVIEAKTNDDFIDQQVSVVVMAVYNNNVLVKRAEKEIN